MGYVGRIGLDPEVAIISKKTGKGRSAHQFQTDRKRYKFYTEKDEDGYQNELEGSEVERDGAAIEIRSIVDSACRDNIIPYVAEALRQTHLRLNTWKGGRFELSTTPLFRLDAASLENAPDDVSQFGCRPDMDAYTLQTKDPVCSLSDRRRYTGGHIHVSRMGANTDVEQQAALAILFDYFIAVPMVAILNSKFAEGEAERRIFYGQPGSFRYDNSLDKMEFRTLSGRLLLHPTLMYWILGAVKSMITGINGADYKGFLKNTMKPAYDTTLIYHIISSHDYEEAERIALEMWKLLPSYHERESDLANSMGGGGEGTLNPYFYEQSLRVFLEGVREGIMWDDDMVYNWGLYDDYEPVHHQYWGIQQAMVGMCDDDIFPFNSVLPRIWPKNYIHKKTLYTHPKNGGVKEYVVDGAAEWLA